MYILNSLDSHYVSINLFRVEIIGCRLHENGDAVDLHGHGGAEDDNRENECADRVSKVELRVYCNEDSRNDNAYRL